MTFLEVCVDCCCGESEEPMKIREIVDLQCKESIDYMELTDKVSIGETTFDFEQSDENCLYFKVKIEGITQEELDQTVINTYC